MHRATLVVGVAFLVAIPLGGLGAWAFNPDSGAVLHNEVLWRIFGIMCEGSALLLTGLVLVAGLTAVVRKTLALSCRSTQP
jgi:hypothetical protein